MTYSVVANEWPSVLYKIMDDVKNVGAYKFVPLDLTVLATRGMPGSESFLFFFIFCFFFVFFLFLFLFFSFVSTRIAVITPHVQKKAIDTNQQQ